MVMRAYSRICRGHPAVAALLKADGHPARFLYASGYAGSPEESALAPDAPLLRKPWTAEELALKVREVLEMPAAI